MAPVALCVWSRGQRVAAELEQIEAVCARYAERVAIALDNIRICEYRDAIMLPAIKSMAVQPASRFFKALGDETRLRIVALLTHGELCVCHLESALDLTQSNTSRQLGVLRAAGVVEARREGSWVYYRLAPQVDEFCKGQLSALVRVFDGRDILRRDVARLLESRGPGACK